MRLRHTGKATVIEDRQREQVDALLQPLLAAEHAEFEDILEHFTEEYVLPIIDRIVRSKLYASLDGRDGSFGNQESLDVRSEALIAVTKNLRAWRDGGAKSKTISDFRSYVSSIAYIKCADHLRRRFPQRAILKNKVRYILTHVPLFQLRQTIDRQWLCELASKRNSNEAHERIARSIDLEILRERHAQLAVWCSGECEGANLVQVIEAIIAFAKPVELDALVGAVAELFRIVDEPQRRLWTDDESNNFNEQVRDTQPTITQTLEQRDYLVRLWREILQLPLLQRMALLLNLRDAKSGGDLLTLLPQIGIASLPDVAVALEIPFEDFALLWNQLPLEDAVIAMRLRLTRQQVINLRKSARARLARRMQIVE